MNNTKNDSYYVEKILTDLNFIKQHMTGVTKKELSENEILLDSMMFRLIQLSENSKKLSDKYIESHPYIPWKDISGLRNRIVHDYGNVGLEIVYVTLSADIPALIELFDN